MRACEAERVERPGLDEALHHPTVHEAQVDARAEILERAEGALRAPGRQDRLHRGLADVLDRRQAETDRVAGHGELHGRHVHVWRLDADPHRPTLFDVLHDLVGVAHFRSQQRRHELDRIVRLEVRGLVGDEPVRRGVRVVDGDTVGDEAVGAGNLEVVRRLDPFPHEPLRSRPPYPGIKQGFERGRGELFGEIAQRVSTDSALPTITEYQSIRDTEFSTTGFQRRKVLRNLGTKRFMVQGGRNHIDRAAGEHASRPLVGCQETVECDSLVSDQVGAHGLGESGISVAASEEVDRIADAAPAPVCELLAVNRRWDSKLEEQSADVPGQTFRRRGVIDGSRLYVNATVTLKHLSHETGHRSMIPAVDDRGHPLVGRDLSLEPAGLEQERHGVRRPCPINANGPDRGRLAAGPMLHTRPRIRERGEDRTHVLDLVGDRRVQVEVAGVA